MDPETDSVTVKVSIRNNGSEMVHSPLYVKVLPSSSDFGTVEFVNPTPASGLDPNYMDVTSYIKGGSLATGESTMPFSLMFHITNRQPSAQGGNQQLRQTVVDMNLQIFSRRPASVEVRTGRVRE